MFLPLSSSRSLAALALSLALSACGGTTPDPSKAPLNYTGNAQRAYETGMQQYQKGNYLEAAKYFTTVKRRFPYSQYAILSELRIADASFQREQYLEAIDGYKLFIKFHPSNENVPYSQYQIALAHFNQGPEDWWFLPPSHEKDLSAVVDGLKETQKFLKLYPASGLLPKAKKLLEKCERKLGDYELYVAKFYIQRSQWAAALGRLEYMVQSYTTLANDEELLYRLGSVYAAAGRHPQARLVFEKLKALKPQNKWSKQVASYLSRPAPTPTPTPTPAPTPAPEAPKK